MTRLTSILTATAAICGALGLSAAPASATALFAVISGNFGALSATEAQYWEDLTDLSAVDLMAGGSFTGAIYIDKPQSGDDKDLTDTVATYNPPFPSLGSHELGSFVSLQLQIGGNIFKGGLEPFSTVSPGSVSYDEKLSRRDSPGTSNDTLSFATGYSGAVFDGADNSRTLEFTFLGLEFEDALPDPLNPPDLSQLLSGSFLQASVSSFDGPDGDKTSTLTGSITSASGLKTLDQIINEASSGGGSGQTGHGTVDDPLLPAEDPETPANGTYQFNIGGIGLFGNGTEFPIFIDPEVAIGYQFDVTSGPLFATVVVPDLLPDNEFLLKFNGEEHVLLAGQVLDFTALFPDGISSFRIEGIDPALMLDPNNALAFNTGVTFVDPGPVAATADVTMTAITAFVDDGSSMTVSEPGTLGLASIGLVALWRARRRRMAAPTA